MPYVLSANLWQSLHHKDRHGQKIAVWVIVKKQARRRALADFQILASLLELQIQLGSDIAEYIGI